MNKHVEASNTKLNVTTDHVGGPEKAHKPYVENLIILLKLAQNKDNTNQIFSSWKCTVFVCDSNFILSYICDYRFMNF